MSDKILDLDNKRKNIAQFVDVKKITSAIDSSIFATAKEVLSDHQLIDQYIDSQKERWNSIRESVPADYLSGVFSKLEDSRSCLKKGNILRLRDGRNQLDTKRFFDGKNSVLKQVLGLDSSELKDPDAKKVARALENLRDYPRQLEEAQNKLPGLIESLQQNQRYFLETGEKTSPERLKQMRKETLQAKVYVDLALADFAHPDLTTLRGALEDFSLQLETERAKRGVKELAKSYESGSKEWKKMLSTTELGKQVQQLFIGQRSGVIIIKLQVQRHFDSNRKLMNKIFTNHAKDNYKIIENTKANYSANILEEETVIYIADDAEIMISAYPGVFPPLGSSSLDLYMQNFAHGRRIENYDQFNQQRGIFTGIPYHAVMSYNDAKTEETLIKMGGIGYYSTPANREKDDKFVQRNKRICEDSGLNKLREEWKKDKI